MADINPLNWQIPIVNANRTPTDEFQRAWAGLQSATGAIPALDTQAEVSAVLDKIGATPGSLLHRATSGWQIITGADGDLLRRGAAGWQLLPSPNDPTQFLAGDLTWQTPATGGGGDLYTTSAGSGGASVNTGTNATKGGSITPLDVPITIDKVYFTLDTPANGSQYKVIIAVGTTITAVLGTTNTLTWNTGDPVEIALTFASPVTLTVGVRHFLLVSWSNAPTGTSALRIMGNTQLGSSKWPGVLSANPPSGGDGMVAPTATPGVGTSLGTNGVNHILSFRYTR